jgi:hypothetical protein
MVASISRTKPTHTHSIEKNDDEPAAQEPTRPTQSNAAQPITGGSGAQPTPETAAAARERTRNDPIATQMRTATEAKLVEGTSKDDHFRAVDAADGGVDIHRNDEANPTHVSPGEHAVIRGGDGNDTIDLSAVTNRGLRVDAGSGDDTVIGGSGDDIVDAGAGDDTIDLSRSVNASSVYGGEGDDRIIGTAGNDIIRSQGGNDTIDAGAGRDYVEGGDDKDAIRGGDGKDTIYGGRGADTISGDAERDFINGGDGNDALSGGDGNDVLFGVRGNDGLYGDAGDDFLAQGQANGTGAIEDGGAGNNRIFTSADYRASVGSSVSVRKDPNDPEFASRVNDDLEAMRSWGLGSDVLARMDATGKKTEIIHDESQNDNYARSKHLDGDVTLRPDGTRAPGDDVVVGYIPSLTSLNNGQDWSEVDPMVILGGHEFSHAIDLAEGRWDKGETTEDAGNVVPNYERRAVGLPYNGTPAADDHTFNENRMRDELGLPRRRSYRVLDPTQK